MVAVLDVSGPRLAVGASQVRFVNDETGREIESQPIPPTDGSTHSVTVASEHEASGEFSCSLA